MQEYTYEIEQGRLGLWNWFVHAPDGHIIAGGTTKTGERAYKTAERVIRIIKNKEKSNA